MRTTPYLIAGLLLVIAISLLGLIVGPAPISPLKALAALTGTGADSDQWIHTVVMQVRLPRVLLAIAIGASLAQTGVVLQALFRNPLAEPSLLGISGGAALAAAAWLVIVPSLGLTAAWLATLSLPLAATAGALIAATVVVQLARRRGTTDMATLLLTGLSINALAGAGIALLQSLASDSVLRDLLFWFYGSLGRAAWPQLAVGLPLLLAIALWLPREAKSLDALLLGEAEAAHLGVHIEPLKRRLLVLVAVAAATAVALAGVIGFIGLIVPHFIRQLLGPSHHRLLPLAGLSGAGLLCLADTVARTAYAPVEIPVGVLTAFFGAPLFLFLLQRRGQHQCR